MNNLENLGSLGCPISSFCTKHPIQKHAEQGRIKRKRKKKNSSRVNF